jgi:hypothetical protein
MDMNDLHDVLARSLRVTGMPHRRGPVVTRWHWLALALSFAFLGWLVTHG